MKKNILLITVRSDTGGGPRHVNDLLEGLYKDLKLYIAAPDNDKYSSSYKKLAKGFLPIPHRSFSLITLFQIYLFCRANHIEIIHSHGFGAGIYSRPLSLFFKVIHTYHGIHETSSLKTFIEKVLLKFPQKVIYVSNSEKETAKKLNVLHPNHKVIPNGIKVPTNISPMSLPKEPDDIILGALTRLDPHKGNHLLISYMKELPPHYKLFIAGPGPEYKNLKEQISKLNLSSRVFLLGEVSPYPFLSSIDIYVSASKGEGLPYSVLEAMSVNKKIVLSNVTGHRELLESNSLFTLEDTKDFTKKIGMAFQYSLNEKYKLGQSLNHLKDLYS